MVDSMFSYCLDSLCESEWKRDMYLQIPGDVDLQGFCAYCLYHVRKMGKHCQAIFRFFFSA